MTKEEKIHFETKLLNHLSLSFKNHLSNVSVKDIFLMLSSININFTFEEVKKGSPLNTIKSKRFGGTAYYNNIKKEYGIEIIVYNSLEEMKWEECVDFIISSSMHDRLINDLSYTYLHELHHIFQRHLINHSKYTIIAERLLLEVGNKKIDQDLNVSELLNIAFDYHINSIIYNTGLFMDLYKKENINILYSSKYDATTMSELDILKDLILNGEIKKQTQPNANYITIDIKPTKEDKTMTVILHLDIKPQRVDDLEDNYREMNNVLNSSIVKMKGTGSAQIMKQLDIPITVEISWIDKLEPKINNISYSYSKKKNRMWSKPNMFYKKVNLPGRKKQKQSSDIYVVIDYSASMSNYEIRKINYILLELHRKDFNLTILGHTTKLEFVKEIGRKEDELKEYIKYRYYSGGTSHREVFDYLETNIEEENNLVLFLSDMESDIENIWCKYTWQKKSDLIFLDSSEKLKNKFSSFVKNNGCEYILMNN